MDATAMPQVPRGSGEHPVALTVLRATDAAAAAQFYNSHFGWMLQATPNPDVFVGGTPAGQAVALRSGLPEGFPGAVPFIAVAEVDAAMEQALARGFALETAKWKLPMLGELARVKPPSGAGLQTREGGPEGPPHFGPVYGLLAASNAELVPKDPLPSGLGSGGAPPEGAVCSLELHSSDFAQTAATFSALFGWGTRETMPGYMMFDPGAGMSGVFQSHTPAIPALAYIYAADVAAKLAALEAAGAKPSGPPMSMPGFGTFGYFVDLSGTHVGLIGPA